MALARGAPIFFIILKKGEREETHALTRGGKQVGTHGKARGSARHVQPMEFYGFYTFY